MSTEEDAVALARDEWARHARDIERSGREVPVRELPPETGDLGRQSCEATAELGRASRSRTYGLSFSLAEMERARAARQSPRQGRRATSSRKSGKRGRGH